MQEPESFDEGDSPEQRDWVIAKSLLEAIDLSVAALEHHARYSMYHDEPPDDVELVTHLQEARKYHEQALADLEAALKILEASD